MMKVPSNCLGLSAAILLACSGFATNAAHANAEDRAAIEDLHGRYLFAFDWQDAETYAGTFAPDGVLDYGAGEIRGREAIAAFIREGRQRTEQARANTPEGQRPPGAVTSSATSWWT